MTKTRNAVQPPAVTDALMLHVNRCDAITLRLEELKSMAVMVSEPCDRLNEGRDSDVLYGAQVFADRVGREFEDLSDQVSELYNGMVNDVRLVKGGAR